MFGQVINL